MSVTVKCPQCLKSYVVGEEDLGRLVQCARCAARFTLEATADTTVPAFGAGLPPVPGSPDELSKIGRYVIRARLGGGTMGEVWLAHDPTLDRDVAVKTLRREHSRNREHRERFLHEARAAAKLHHTNAVAIYEVGADGDVAFIAMEYVDGSSLEQAVASGRPLDWREATRAIRDAAAGLGAAHEIGLVHRDVKPANLLRTSKGVAKVADFGLARAQAADIRMTREGVFLGTPSYMAPERWRGEEADVRGDLYSLICTYFQLLTGRVPFDATRLPALGQQHLFAPVPDPRNWAPNLPDAVCRILLRGMAKEPRERYPSAAALIADLDRLLACGPAQLAFGMPWERLGGRRPEPPRPPESPKAASRPAPVGPRRPAGRRRSSLAAAITVLLAALCVAAVVYVIGVRRRGPPTAQAPPKPKPAEDLSTNSLGMKLVLVPAGEFLMGTDESADDFVRAFSPYRRSSGPLQAERPQHRVRLPAFWMGVHEVTVGQFRAFVDDAGYQTDAERGGKGSWGFDSDLGRLVQRPEFTWRNPGFEQTDDHPVVNVSWNDAAAFCEWLSGKEGKTYRLPSEAQWEYACRAGTMTRYSTGDEPEGVAEAGNIADADAAAKFPHRIGLSASDGHVFPAPVGRFKPNAFGLYDMHGNVWEWCHDFYDEGYYAASPLESPPGPVSGTTRVLRGGAWDSPPHLARSATRAGNPPHDRDSNTGFRVVRVAGP